jgi:hypothetical protein
VPFANAPSAPQIDNNQRNNYGDGVTVPVSPFEQEPVPTVAGFIPYADAPHLAAFLRDYNAAHPAAPVYTVFALQINLPASLRKLWRRAKAYKIKVKTSGGYAWWDPRHWFLQKTVGASPFMALKMPKVQGIEDAPSVVGAACRAAMDLAKDASDCLIQMQTFKKRK